MMKFLSSLVAAAALLAPVHAAVVLVDFGATNSGLTGYNEITSLASLGTAVSLTTKTGESSGLSLSYAGSTTPSTAGVAGINNAMNRGTDAANAWSSISEGEAIATVSSQGLGFATSGGQVGVFTLSGLIAGEQYSIMLLSGAGSAGGTNSYLTFVGVESGYSFTGYDNAAGKTATYTAGTDTLNFAGYAGSGTAQSLALTFTASSTDLQIRIGGAPLQQAVQGLAIVPEPSIPLLGALGLLGAAMGRRRRA